MNGSCHCGQVQVVTNGDPTWLGRCHCRDCQKISGSAYMAYAEFSLANVTFTKGAPGSYKSSANTTRTFCRTCGTPIEWKRDDIPERTSLTLGLFDSTPEFANLDDLYEEEAPSWRYVICY